ncbi:hypothetical protein D039_1271A, partial [Vibrio parahaemolyticus EKP-028]
MLNAEFNLLLDFKVLTFDSRASVTNLISFL